MGLRSIDPQPQARVFEAFFAARPRHSLLTGLFTWGFNYSAMVDNGPSIAGKRAESVLRSHYLPAP